MGVQELVILFRGFVLLLTWALTPDNLRAFKKECVHLFGARWYAFVSTRYCWVLETHAPHTAHMAVGTAYRRQFFACTVWVRAVEHSPLSPCGKPPFPASHLMPNPVPKPGELGQASVGHSRLCSQVREHRQLRH